jgi:aspartyl-tRNA(Asn)/glutamyl-tRNA(Gln) amidotransferase subunit A
LRAYQARALSPVEVTRAALARIEERNPRFNAFLTVTAEQALQAAQAAQEAYAHGRAGALSGVPIAIKDLFDTAGVRTTAGSKILRDNVPAGDATAVERLRQAGMVMVGKTHLNEFAMGGTGENGQYGPARNPWNPERMPGGSSSGSAIAVVTGMALGALGSDTGGSIRIPASACGCFGLKPTYGRVSRAGAFPLAWTLDHVGPLTSTAEDAARMLAVLAGHDPRDPASSREPVPDYLALMRGGARDLRLSAPTPEVFAAMNPAVRPVIERALADLRPLVRSIATANPDWGLAEATQTVTSRTEATAHHRAWMRERPQDYSPEILARLDFGLLTSGVAYAMAQQARARLRARLDAFWKDHDVLITETLPIPPPLLGATEVEIEGAVVNANAGLLKRTMPFNLLGVPACSVPAGFTADGLPVGLQLVAAPHREDVLLRLAHAYQQVTDWHLRRPAE